MTESATTVHFVETPFGPFHMRASGGAIVAAGWREMQGGAPCDLLREAAGQVAINAVLHGELRPSHIMLPVIDR